MTTMVLVVPTLILLLGVVDDLRLKRVPNKHNLVFGIVALLSNIYFQGTAGALNGGLALLTAFIFCLPLVWIKALGAGDMKLLMAFSLSVDWHAVFYTAVASLVWGALLGVVRAIIAGNGLLLVKNTTSLLSRNKNVNDLHLTKIPYTVALFFGWLTHLSLELHGGRL